MIALFLVPAVLSLFLIAAHLVRAGNLAAALTALLATAIVFVRRRWAVHLLKVILSLAVIEWIHALISFTSERMGHGEPRVRLVVILGSVTIFTILSLVLLNTRRARAWYRVEERAR